MTDTIPAADRPKIEKTIFSRGVRRMFGFNLDWWNAAVLLSLGGGALAAVAIMFTTAVVVKLQKQEAIDTANEFARYKLETEAKIAEAETRTAEAKLQLAKLTTPRLELLTPDARARFVEKLKPFAGTQFDTGLAINSGEQADFLWAFRPLLQDAGWILLPWSGPGPLLSFGSSGLPVSGSVAAQNIEIHLHPQSRDKLQPAADALISALRDAGIAARYWGFNVSSNNVDAVHILVGDKR
jgi:hypothetical protein